MDEPEITITYRGWTLLVPILMIAIGGILLVGVGPENASLALMGGIIAFIGILTLGVLLVMVLGLNVSARMLKEKSQQTPPSFREKIESNEQKNETKSVD